MLERPELGAVILAAGDSTRFQPGPKALPPPRGADLLARSVAALGLAGLERPTVVANPGQPAVIGLAGDLGCRVIVNPDPGRGMFSSVRLAFAGAGGESVLVLPVDAGLVSADSILSVAARFMELGREGRGLAVLPAQGGRLGHPPAIGRDLLGSLASYGGPGGLRWALAGLAGSREEAGAVLGARLPAAGQAGQGSRLRFLSLDDPMVGCDVDTRGDLDRFLDLRAQSGFRPEPSPRKALALLALAGPPRKMAHCLAVAVAALRLALAIGSGAAELAFVGGLVHDLVHGRPRHDQEARGRLAALGWESAAEVAGNHTELGPAARAAIGLDGGAAGTWGAPVGELEAILCVHLADKYVKGTCLVGLEARFDPAWAREASGEARAAIARRRLDALFLDAWFERSLGGPAERAILSPSGHELEDLASQAAGGPAGPVAPGP